MDVRVLVYLEPTDDGSLVWCAETDDVVGFYAADDDLQGLLVRTEHAIIDAVAVDRPSETVSIRWQLVGHEPSEGLDLGTDSPHVAMGHPVVTASGRTTVAA